MNGLMSSPADDPRTQEHDYMRIEPPVLLWQATDNNHICKIHIFQEKKPSIFPKFLEQNFALHGGDHFVFPSLRRQIPVALTATSRA
eukprot:1161615-Pelagomonas_calceolata.AAC.7